MLTGAEGWEFESQPSQANVLPNLYLSLHDLVLDIASIGQGLVSTVSGYNVVIVSDIGARCLAA